MTNSLILLDAALGALAVYLVRCILQKPKDIFPPGPKGLPVLGNVLDMPKSKEWLTFAKWGREYGGILSISVMGRKIVIVNSADIMEELDKKGSIYSDRPRLEMGGELVGYSDTLVLMRYGSRFRTYRKHFARYIGGSTQMQLLHPLLEAETRVLLRRILAHHTELMGHLRKLAGGIILGLTYGYEVQEGEDPFINLIERANENFNQASVPGNFLVDFFPILRSLPEWLPGMGFMETSRKWAKDTAAMVEVPFDYTKKQIAAGTAVPSFVSTSLEDESKLTSAEYQDLKFTASSLYGGGADTTVSSEYAFFLAMVLHPEVQKKAQAELDAVVGDGRLPTFADRPNLPYINAVVTEALRWNSVAPTGVPHVATEDGFVNGYFIPKGTLIMSNLWNMLHDPEIYPEPFVFNPERHIAQPGKPAQREPRTICFGYGRRVCPGMYLADASLFITIARALAVFDITNAIENGVPVIPIHENTSGTISYPEPFKCTIKPRSAKAISLITENVN